MRQTQGLSLRELAQLSGVSHGYIGEIERGTGKTPTDRVIRALELALARNLIAQEAS